MSSHSRKKIVYGGVANVTMLSDFTSGYTEFTHSGEC